MTNPESTYVPRSISTADIKYEPSTLALPQTSNLVEVSHTNGTVFIDFGFIDHLYQLGKVADAEPQPARAVARVAISPQAAIQLSGQLAMMVSQMGYRWLSAEAQPVEEPDAG